MNIIWFGTLDIIALCDVQNVQRVNDGAMIITKHTKWNFEHDTWENNIWLYGSELENFIDAWTKYIQEREKPK